MKLLITVISSLLVGLSMASSNFSPIHELQYLLGNKRRLLTACGAAFTGYVFIVAAVLISLVEAGLQYDVQGFVMWSSLFTVSLILLAVAAASLLMARTLLPARMEYRDSPFSELNKQFNVTETIDALLRRYAEATAPREPSAPPEREAEPASKPEPQARPQAPVENPIFRETPTADVLHH